MVTQVMARAFGSLIGWLDSGLDLAFPWPESQEAEPEAIQAPFCDKCGFPFPSLDGQAPFICSTCSFQKWDFDWARSGYCMKGQVRESIVGFKYFDQFHHRGQLVKWLGDAFGQHGRRIRWDALVPVPLYHLRLRERGFNQAKELADGLGERKKLRTFECLYRCRDTGHQARLTRRARWENLRDAFRLKAGFDVRNLNLLLIDDVFTTGATAHACAKALRGGGAGQVAVLTIAQS